MSVTPVDVGGYIAEYLGTAYLTQLIHQSFENTLARGDLQKAISEKCGSAGASNTADLEKQILQPNPMSPSGFYRFPTSFSTLFRPSQWTRLPTSDFISIRFPWLNQFRMLPILRNPYLLFQAGMYSWGSKLEQNQEGGGKWAAIALGASVFIADAGRGFRFLNFAPFSRVPSIRVDNPNFDRTQRHSPRFNYITYEEHLRRVSTHIQCNQPPPPEGGLPEPISQEAPMPEPTPALESNPVAQPEANGEALPAGDIDPTNMRRNLARRTLSVYGGGSTYNPFKGSLFEQGLQSYYSAPLIITPVQMPLSFPTFSLSIFSGIRPLVFAP